jgi:Phosphotransferase enzyme family
MTGALAQRALTAAGVVAAAHGLSADEAVVVYSGSNVLVHLRPAPVVARVMTGTVALHSDPQRWLERELSVLRFLGPTGLGVSPSQLVAPGPHQYDGLWMTFTEWVADAELATDLDDAQRLGQTLRSLHDELRPFTGELGDLGELRDRIERLLDQLRPADAHEAAAISSLDARLSALRTGVFESDLPTQALHGDVSLRNLLRTANRLVWNDFEDTFRGPVHWDVASYVGSFRGHGASPGLVRKMLNGYGWDDEEELAPFSEAQNVYDEIWRMYDRQRRRS